MINPATEEVIELTIKGVHCKISQPKPGTIENIKKLFEDLATKKEIQKVVPPMFEKQEVLADIGKHQRVRNTDPFRVLIEKYMKNGMTKQQFLDTLTANDFRHPAKFTLRQELFQAGWRASRGGPDSKDDPITYRKEA